MDQNFDSGIGSPGTHKYETKNDVGIDINGTKIDISSFNLHGSIIKVPTPT